MKDLDVLEKQNARKMARREIIKEIKEKLKQCDSLLKEYDRIGGKK